MIEKANIIKEFCDPKSNQLYNINREYTILSNLQKILCFRICLRKSKRKLMNFFEKMINKTLSLENLLVNLLNLESLKCKFENKDTAHEIIYHKAIVDKDSFHNTVKSA